MKIFNVVFGMLICLAPVGAHAAGDFECGYFNPAFGLCSTHSHNIGAMDDKTNLPVNPTKSEETAQMNDVIALKSTVIAQQLKEQYDALNAVIKRFKTQLEKAVLTSKIEVLTGNSASGNTGGGASASGSYSSSGGVVIAGASDCMTYSGSSNVGSCLMTNSAIIVNAANSDTSAAKKQLANDLYVADMYGLCHVTGNDKDLCCPQVQVKSSTDKAISDKVSGLNKNQIISCAQKMRAKISTNLEDKQSQNRNNQWNSGGNSPVK